MADSDMAARWLQLNIRNRPLNHRSIEKYASDMANGRWRFAADPIRFDKTGRLLDGQHRLIALSSCPGLTLPMLIVRGLATESQSIMDQGSRRSTGQQLALSGVKNYNNVAAAVRLFLMWQEDLLFRDSALKSQITTARIEELVTETFPDVISMFNDLHTMITKNDATPRVAGAAAIKFLIIDPAATSEFFHLLATGAGVEGHPIVALDQRLRRLRREKVSESDRDVLSFFILAWNAWRDEKRMTKFQRPRGGSWTKENFPVPH